jgi:PAS domain S-box-containing protein
MPTPLIKQCVNRIPALVAFWDAHERCRFANETYLEWFGRTPEAMVGIKLEELLGPIYEKNLQYIQGALGGERQVFNRAIPIPSGEIRQSLATYTPYIECGRVVGFTVHVADITPLAERETELKAALLETISTLEKTKRSFRSKELGELRASLLKICGKSGRVPD